MSTIRALAVETHENWIEATRYLNMEELKDHKKQQLREMACAAARGGRPPRVFRRCRVSLFAEDSEHN